MAIYIQCTFHKIPSIGYKVMAEDDKKTLKFGQSKDNNSSISDDTMVKLHVHYHIMVICIHFKFHEIPSMLPSYD